MHLPARSDSSMRALQQVQALVPFPVLAVASRSRNNPVPLPPVNLSAPAPLQPTTSSLRQSSVETARLLQLSHADQFLIGLRRGSSGRERTGEGMAREKGLNTPNNPSEASHFWEDDSRILGGRDGLGHGTWLAVNRGGRVACITNVREMTLRPATPGLLLSRGELPVRFLLTNRSVEEYLQAVDLDLYPGFNLIVADTRKKECASLSNRNSVGYAPLTAGFHAVSNAYVDHDFAKLRRGTERLEELRDQGAFEGGAVPWEELFALLDEETVLERNEEKLPRSFAPPSAEMACSAIFVRPLRWGREQFGTRAQTVLVAWQDGRVELRERSRESDGSWSAVTHAFCAAEDEGLMEEAAMAAE
ncbi:NRDE protein [Helicosporidium sp. ATCC 50920]|nr:NRDE protein [Helicosporidium sp. ATCC 50920]|eukprot:KDD76431.1 NRDE protein [Helicosporidium sp. ATCC 50920]